MRSNTNLDKILKNKELWNLFTRKEEYSPKELDRHERFLYSTSSYRNIILEPVISKFLIENGSIVEYPENKKFTLCLTHDIDDIYPPISHTFLSSLYCIKSFNLNELRNQLLWKKRGKKFSPYWNFKEIMKLEEKYCAKSSFYFIATERDIRRFRYDIGDLENELGFIADKGWEVGLHGGYYTYNNLDEIKKEKKRLEKVLGKGVIGYRSHYLRFKTPDTWELLSDAGFNYDTTFGYDNMVGFRNGMCHPFKPFSLINNKEINILEIPLNIMDGTLFIYIGIREAWTITKRLIDTVEKYHGILTLLWHNSTFNCPFREKWFKLYNKILDYSYEKNAWIVSGEEVWKWWQT